MRRTPDVIHPTLTLAMMLTESAFYCSLNGNYYIWCSRFTYRQSMFMLLDETGPLIFFLLYWSILARPVIYSAQEQNHLTCLRALRWPVVPRIKGCNPRCNQRPSKLNRQKAAKTGVADPTFHPGLVCCTVLVCSVLCIAFAVHCCSPCMSTVCKAVLVEGSFVGDVF